LVQAQNDLGTILADANATQEQINKAVSVLRQARKKVREAADAAEKDLLDLLTDDQAATLVSLGYID
jgi:hypothetical protein